MLLLREHHLKHLKDNLPIYPDDPTFSQQFMSTSSDDVVPSTSRQSLPHEEEVKNGQKLPNSSLRKNKTPVKSPLQDPKMEGFRLSSLELQGPKCHVKQGSIKSSKKLKFMPKNDE